MALRHDFRSRPPEQVRVVVFGATGYIGRFVVRELVERGYQVVAFARERSGIGGSKSQEQEDVLYFFLHFYFGLLSLIWWQLKSQTWVH